MSTSASSSWEDSWARAATSASLSQKISSRKDPRRRMSGAPGHERPRGCRARADRRSCENTFCGPDARGGSTPRSGLRTPPSGSEVFQARLKQSRSERFDQPRSLCTKNAAEPVSRLYPSWPSLPSQSWFLTLWKATPLAAAPCKCTGARTHLRKRRGKGKCTANLSWGIMLGTRVAGYHEGAG